MNPWLHRSSIKVDLTMRLSDARSRRRRTKALYPNHRLPPWLNEDETRDRSNRLLGVDCQYVSSDIYYFA
jgi:hypothetical protein